MRSTASLGNSSCDDTQSGTGDYRLRRTLDLMNASRLNGTIALQGGSPFTANDDLDRRLLAAVGASHVVVLPTADAFERPERLVAAAMNWAVRLELGVEALRVMRQNNWTPEQLAKEIGVSVPTVSRWRVGMSNPLNSTLRLVRGSRDMRDHMLRRPSMRLDWISSSSRPIAFMMRAGSTAELRLL